MKNFTKIGLSVLIVIGMFISCQQSQKSSPNSYAKHGLEFEKLAHVWDEAIPLGNATVGNLVWQKSGRLRFSLDRADLWDLRPMENIDFDKWKFKDVYKHWKAGEYNKVQEAFDVPYDKLPAPSKIPAGAIEFNIDALGDVKKVDLDVSSAICTVEWINGARLTTFVHASEPVGWYQFENLPEELSIEMISPSYDRPNEEGYTSQAKTDLNQLGYKQGVITKGDDNICYNQNGWNDFKYQIYTQWEKGAQTLTGCWSISSENEKVKASVKAEEVVANAVSEGYLSAKEGHLLWWKNYWAQSSISIPDDLLERQYYLEMYKFGSAARADAPPISLQAVWTADHGKLPPWKGDFHHDLNTQLSYWPAYTGNYLNLEEGFINWLWEHRDVFKKYTRDYFDVNGMNVPGVSTLDGEPMGGWIQYSFGQTVASWLGHHFYLHWQYTMDRDFLEQKAYPWLKDVAIYLDEMAVKDEKGRRKLLISSSPEIYDNSAKAWFSETTNFDLALIRWNYEKAAELAAELGLKEDADKWLQILSEWPELAIDEETGLMFAPEVTYHESHRHFSHLMGFHPLGLIDISNGSEDAKTINNTLQNLEAQGSGAWTGYSFSWQGNLYARAFDGDNAARVLRIFAECFCLKNSFHANGDQCQAGYSNMTYRPFTLEGNFAFASAIQDMLIQSHTGIVKLFPALPSDWKDVSFNKLRTYGAFLVSAEMKMGKVDNIEIMANADGEIQLQNPFDSKFKCSHEFTEQNGILTIKLKKGDVLVANVN
ncbi:glycoside hydrolase N-terminal domain-containing protein [Carboxylicivirga sediminis]|uniref:Glycoside hydrolase N-terminal domain-containing protein n=1 Tax=Carboxylicivirga sediminis TaxID=2006564 RepID=A0A941F3U8_9BACT|nr:glycoside hydrolase N-terminal domain-containing protein [Carboxylicivirga sediminis]MBR8535892.1 glycoside hydrolase N-terminal domain-containing protein [Carboxylicivirga sediminis]